MLNVPMTVKIAGRRTITNCRNSGVGSKPLAAISANLDSNTAGGECLAKKCYPPLAWAFTIERGVTWVFQ